MTLWQNDKGTFMIREEFIKARNRISRPQRIGLAVTRDENGRIDIITLAWFMETSIKPPMYAISIGNTRYSYENLQKYRKFVLAIPSQKMAEQSLKCGTTSGRNIDKIKEFQIKVQKGRYSDIPILADAVANFECEIITQIQTGDHTIFVGQVKYSWVNEDKSFIPLLMIDGKDERFRILIKDKRYVLGL